MNNTIRDREELLLAKIAGKDVDIKTMTPGVATNLKEKLCLDIAKRIDDIESSGGSGGGISLVATYTEDNGTWTCDKTFAEIIAAIQANKNVKFQRITDLGGGMVVVQNLSFDGIALNNNTPAAIIVTYTSVHLNGMSPDGIDFFQINHLPTDQTTAISYSTAPTT